MSTASLLHTWRPTSLTYAAAAPALLVGRRQLIARALGVDDAAVNENPFTFQTTVPALDPLEVEVLVHVGAASEGAACINVPLHWRAEDDVFSDFDAVLTMERREDGRATLALAGQYVIPDAEPEAVKAATVALAQGLLEHLSAELGADDAPDEVVLPDRPLHVGDVMVPVPVLLRADLPLRTAVLLLIHHDVGGAPVLDGHGRVVGILTESDLLAREATLRERTGWEAREEDRRRLAVTVGDACSRPALTTAPDARLRTAARELLDHDISRMVVVDDGEVVGMLTRRGVLHGLVRSGAALHTAVDQALASVPGVTADIDRAGQVHLTGVATLHTDAKRAVQLVAAIDGVTGIHNDLTWERDDAPAPSSGFG